MSPAVNKVEFSTGKGVAVSAVHGNVEQEVIVITEDRLMLRLREHEAEIRQSRDWLTPFGLLVTIIITLVTADFKPALGLSKDTWAAIFVLGAVSSLVWLAIAVKNVRKVTPMRDLVNKIKGVAPTPTEVPTETMSADR